MSWVAASFAIVFGVLLAGWLAYERSRPSARMAAVVGTLAAVAALGRDAFVAVPDVKPITAITLVVGYALGPLPGFAVGAVGMLASNVMLGQGSYTPWQMAAWGLVGLAGAALGRLSGRRVGRVGIALACALTAMAAKEIMNIYTWTLGASHTPAALLAAAGVALPFDVTDAVASFLFGLAFGPELARLLGRMRARMDVTWEAAAMPPALVAAVLVCAGMSAAGAPTRARGAPVLALASRPPIVVGKAVVSRAPTFARRTPAVARRAAASGAISRGVAYLEGAQNAGGGFGGAKGQRSSELYSAWAAIGLAAGGRDPRTLARGGHTLLSSIEGEASTLQGAGDEERTILALRACGASTRRLPGGDPVARLLRFRSSDGSFGRLVNLTAFAVFALRAGGRSASDPIVRATGAWLQAQQNPNGGFSYGMRGGASDVDDTAAALQAVVDAGGGSPAVGRAVAYLQTAVNRDGGYPQQPGGESNAQSTAWAAQALVAAGRDPGGPVRGAARSPLAYLESLIASDGSVRYSRSSSQTPVWVTAQALTALARKPFPISPAPASRSVWYARTPTHSPSGIFATRAHRQASRPAGSTRSAELAAGAARHPKAGGDTAVEARLNAIARLAGELVGLTLTPVLG